MATVEGGPVIGENKYLSTFCEEIKQYKIFDLPIGVYVVTEDGHFIECNSRVREILQLKDPINEDSISNYYLDPNERERLKRETEKAEQQGILPKKQVIAFKVNECKRWVLDYCRSITDPKADDKTLGYIGCLEDVTDEYRFHELFNHLPAGVYQLDADGKIERVNKAVANMFGYDSPDEMKGLDAKDLYADPSDYDGFTDMVKKEGQVQSQVWEMTKETGDKFYASLSAFEVKNLKGNYMGRDGTIVDVTEQERLRRIIANEPIGIYEVKNKDGMDVIDDCNEQFAKMFGYDSPDRMKGIEVLKLHASEEEYNKFMKELIETDRQRRPLLEYPLKVKTAGGEEKTIEVSSSVQHRDGTITGRIGASRDITEEVELKERVNDFTADFGGILHSFSSALSSVEQNINSAISALDNDPFPQGFLPVELADNTLEQPASELVTSLTNLINWVDSPEKEAVFSSSNIKALKELLELLQNYRDKIPAIELRPPALEEVACDVINLCKRIRQGSHPGTLIRDTEKKAEELKRITSLIGLRHLKDAVIEMDYEVRSVREYITLHEPKKTPSSYFTVGELISDSLTNIANYRGNMRATVRRYKQKDETEVLVAKRGVVRAISNLIHNAIKYSWNRDIDEKRWVTIRSKIVDKEVWIEFENFGVPITKEEIDNEIIFEIGVRGRLSHDRGRTGTGVGLSDARRIARRHGGDVVISSRPVSPGGREDDYLKNPFITTAILKLPLPKKRGGKQL